MTIHWMIERHRTTNLEATILFAVFYKPFDSLHKMDDGGITSFMWPPQSNCYIYYVTLQKYKNNVSLIGGEQWLIWHCHKALAWIV